jgi:anti-sigma regulatory factor (Ser/Thr protein kinase)
LLVLLSDGIYEYHDAQGEQFGEQRVEAILRESHGKPMAELSAILQDAVQAFAQGAPQEDDMTVVLVKRAAPDTVHRMFRRSFDSLQAIFALTAEFCSRHGVDPGLVPTVDFVAEELFTNMVKYSPQGSPEVRIDMRAITGGVEMALTDYDVEQFDVTRAPDVDTAKPIEQREPGGLGLHLIRRMVDSMEYAYSQERRQGRTTFRKTLAGSARSRMEPGIEE